MSDPSLDPSGPDPGGVEPGGVEPASGLQIVVCVKHVPDATGKREFTADLRVDRLGSDGLLSELDEYAVEQALRVREARPEDSVTICAVTIGPPQAADALRKALQMGVDEAVHVCDDAIAGSDAVATSLILARAVEFVAERAGGVDLVLCGMASTDASMSVVPTMLAERLDWPQLTLAALVETRGDQVRIKRDGDLATEVVGAQLPAVVSVTDQSGEARYPSFKGIMAAKKKPVTHVTLAELDLSPELVGPAAAWTEVTDVSARPARTSGEIVVDADGSGASALVEFLAAGKFV